MDRFRDAVKAFLKEACVYLASQPHGLRTWNRIVRQSDGGISLHTEGRTDFSEALLAFRMQRYKTRSPAFDRLVSGVREDVRLRGVLLVDAGGKSIQGEDAEQWWLENQMGRFIHAYVNRTQGVQFDNRAFSRIYKELREDIESSNITVTEISPLVNATIESEQIPIEAGLRLRQLSIDELEEWFNARTPFSSEPLDIHELPRLQCAVEVIYQQERHATAESNLEAHENVSRLITAMRLLTDGYPRVAFTKRKTSSLLALGFDKSWSPSTSRLGSSAKIAKTQESELLDLYARLGSSPNLSRAKVALARWNSAGDRLTQEDRLIDYWIALESLFVPDATQELSFRTALRIAAFLGSDGTERERIYREMKDSYQLRSEVVHGSIRKKKRKPTTADITNLTRFYLKRALLRILELNRRFAPTELESELLRKD